MTEDWDAELGTEPVAIIPSFNDMAGLMNEDIINGNRTFDLKGYDDGNGFDASDSCIFGRSGGFGKRQVAGFAESVTINENDFDSRGGRRCGFGRGDRAGFPRVNAQNVAVKASGDAPFGRGSPVGRGGLGARGGFGGQSGESSGFGLSRGRTGFRSALATRGGYQGRNEEPFSGSTSRLAGRWNSGDEDDKNQVPKVTYVPPPPPEDENAIFARYQTGINFDKYDDILVDVSGFNVPPAILSFGEAQLCETLNKNINKAGYLKPTPVQKHGIPIVLSGRDLMACAQTGSGKTAAFLLPIIEMLLRGNAASSRFKELQEPEVVIVAPTRELINQIYLEARKFSYGTIVRPVVVYGGTSTGHQIRQVLQGCNILCGTPGRLLDMISKGKVGLGKVQYLVLDEADRMLDMGFEPNMRKLVSSFDMPPKQNRQTLMFSATFPEEIQRLAADFMKSDYLFLAVGQVGGACGDVQQSILQVDQYSKRNKLVEILTNIGIERTMVFVDTKRKADFLATFLCQEKFPTTSIHGDREQREREQALGDFRTGKCPVLVATAVAARGLDIEHVQHVINFDLPSTIDEYVHRIGRTGRCGNVGKAISFFDSNTDLPIARALLKILSDAQQEVPIWLEEFAYAAHGTSYHNPLGKVFASVDTRKGLGVNRNFSGYETNIPVTYGGNHEDTWD